MIILLRLRLWKGLLMQVEQEVDAVSVSYTMEPGRREAQRLKQMWNKTIEDLWHCGIPLHSLSVYPETIHTERLNACGHRLLVMCRNEDQGTQYLCPHTESLLLKTSTDHSNKRNKKKAGWMIHWKKDSEELPWLSLFFYLLRQIWRS